MSNDININESAILETLNAKIDYDGGNYKGSGLANYVVDKSGDVMTGSLKINNAGLELFTPRVTKGTTPSSTVYNGIKFNDSTSTTATAYADTRLGLVESVVQDDGKTRLALLAYQNKASSTTAAGLYLDIDQDGKTYCDFPKCTTKATTTSSAASNSVAVIVKNYVRGTSWYRVWSDGWIEQGGKGAVDGTATTTLPKKFSDANYTLAVTLSGGTGNRYTAQIVDANKAAASFQVYCGHDEKYYWYACGY